MKFVYHYKVKVFSFIMLGFYIFTIYAYITKIAIGIGVNLSFIVLSGVIINEIYTWIIDRPIEVTEEGIGYYVGKKMKYFSKWENVKKVYIPLFDNNHDTTIKVYCPEKIIKIETNIKKKTKEGYVPGKKIGAEILIQYIKDHIPEKVIDERDKWRDKEFSAWLGNKKL